MEGWGVTFSFVLSFKRITHDLAIIIIEVFFFFFLISLKCFNFRGGIDTI